MEQQIRHFVTARSASKLLGVPYLTVIDDIRDGMAGDVPALIGAESGGVWYVAALVDCAETLWHADGMIGEPMGTEAHQALGDLQAALTGGDEPCGSDSGSATTP